MSRRRLRANSAGNLNLALILTEAGEHKTLLLTSWGCAELFWLTRMGRGLQRLQIRSRILLAFVRELCYDMTTFFESHNPYAGRVPRNHLFIEARCSVEGLGH